MKSFLQHLQESAAWTRKAGKDPEGGLNKKGVESYRRENPGSPTNPALSNGTHQWTYHGQSRFYSVESLFARPLRCDHPACTREPAARPDRAGLQTKGNRPTALLPGGEYRTGWFAPARIGAAGRGRRVEIGQFG